MSANSSAGGEQWQSANACGRTVKWVHDHYDADGVRRWSTFDTRAEAEGLERSTRWHYANDLHRHLLSKESGLGPLRPVQVWISRRRSHACIPS